MSIKEEIRRVIEANPGAWRKDLNAVNEGWDPYDYAESGCIFELVLEATGVTFEDDEDAYLELCDSLAEELANA